MSLSDIAEIGNISIFPVVLDIEYIPPYAPLERRTNPPETTLDGFGVIVPIVCHALWLAAWTCIEKVPQATCPIAIDVLYCRLALSFPVIAD